MPKFRDDIPPQYIRDSLDYDPETGNFTWRIRRDRTDRWNAAWAGQPAGSSSCGYVIIKLSGAKAAFGAHRVAWAHYYGAWPLGEIDHINGIKNDNRIVNLREATRSQNMANTRKKAKSRSGFIGVSFHKQSGKWQARCCINYRSVFFGLHATPEAAAQARDEGAKRLHGEFAKTSTS